ncbi:TatD family hydrolase [Marinobacterium sediminicola]|uniref:TatD DNase family protein n=1 Tax=Marinobacterium sediminicola TaxID=518898 RepID=A0ABY1S0F7_9GAMM|nr:TatD family hydrolase [Marinobacterium sediminicola]ULG69672.1 TatD family hydrolase [Marinobacterium sediminicola]SMR74600.1 TatD DNase family protein [Marinobacterium sediminicola]
MLIDTHCHLDFSDFDADREAVVTRALAAEVDHIVIPSVTVDNLQRVIDLCASSPCFHPALGLHPCFPHDTDAALNTLAQALEVNKVVAIGEIGLDFRPGQIEAEVQQPLFEQQLQLARQYDLPVLLHVVRAHDQVLKLLRRYQLPRAGIVHAFSGSEQQAREYAKLGFKLGIGGAISYERAQKLRRLAAELPLEWLVLETDAPDMPLESHRGKPNEPARVAGVAALIAALRGLSIEEVARKTSVTAQQLLRLPAY